MGYISDRPEDHTDFYLVFDENLTRLRTFYHISRPIFEKYSKNYRNWMESRRDLIFSKFAKEEKNGKITIHVFSDEEAKEIAEITNYYRTLHLKGIVEFIPFLLGQIIIFGKSIFDFYINALIENIYPKYYLININNKEEIDKLIEKECRNVHSYSRDHSYKSIINYLRSKFKLDLRSIDYLEDDIIEIWEIRNILVHNKGIIDEKFKEKVKNEKYNIGEKINIDKNLMDKAINSFHNVVTLIDREVKIKFF